MIQYEKLKKSLQHLELQFLNYQNVDVRPELAALDREAIAESVIQRFETAYDGLWKILKRFLIEELGLANVPNSPKPILKLAAQSGMIDELELWLQYADARTATSHDYSESKALASLALMPTFIVHSQKLFHKMCPSDDL